MLLLVQKWFNNDGRTFQAEEACRNPEFEDMFGELQWFEIAKR